MGTEVSLEINGNTLDWSRNGIGIHHGPLFQECDRIQHPAIDGEDTDSFSLDRMALVRPLRNMVLRLEMLGVRLCSIRRSYELAAIEWSERQEAIAEYERSEESQQALKPVSFDEFLDFIRAHPMCDLDETQDWGIEPGVRERNKGRFRGSDFIRRIPNNGYNEPDPASEQGYFVEVINILGPHATLRLLAECPANLDLKVEWAYGQLVGSGWVAAEDVYTGAQRKQRTLVATEGSSDVRILKRALEILRPDVFDFFDFVDIKNRHPFNGTSKMTDFARGLVNIDLQNQIVFLFDNDAEGIAAATQVRQLKLPANMRVMVLPEHEQFKNFPVLVPGGVGYLDINRRAAAIECYLDLRLENRPSALIEWAVDVTHETHGGQGSLRNKNEYAKAFCKTSVEAIRSGAYETGKLERLLDALIVECSLVAQESRASDR